MDNWVWWFTNFMNIIYIYICLTMIATAMWNVKLPNGKLTLNQYWAKGKAQFHMLISLSFCPPGLSKTTKPPLFSSPKQRGWRCWLWRPQVLENLLFEHAIFADKTHRAGAFESIWISCLRFDMVELKISSPPTAHRVEWIMRHSKVAIWKNTMLVGS